MAPLNIERISLRAPSSFARHGRGLAQDIAAGLGGLPRSDRPREIAALDVRLPSLAGESGAALARRIAAEIVWQIGRTK
jgi:hypothetical protein